jgi:broad specificity phosphatase PhoE
VTATVLLIRHAAHGHLGSILSGRTAGIPLSDAGAAQARALPARLADAAPDIVQASPVQRAQETAAALASVCERPVETVAALDEIDFGEWTGQAFADLAGDDRWNEWNSRRSTSLPPGGESMPAAQARASAHLAQVAQRHDGRTVAMVTHCDIIRGVIAGILGLSLDRIHQFDIDPASISRVAVGDWGMRVTSINEVAR